MRTNDIDPEMDDEDESAEAMQAASNAIIHLRELQEHPGWAILLSWVQAQIKNRTDVVMMKAENGTEEIYMKGEVNAFRTFLSIANAIIADKQFDKEVEDARS